jgi:hypothetical protein
MTDREKELVNAHKRYLYLTYKVNQFHLSGTKPPESLIKEFQDLELKVHLISKALE